MTKDPQNENICKFFVENLRPHYYPPGREFSVWNCRALETFTGPQFLFSVITIMRKEESGQNPKGGWSWMIESTLAWLDDNDDRAVSRKTDLHRDWADICIKISFSQLVKLLQLAVYVRSKSGCLDLLETTVWTLFYVYRSILGLKEIQRFYHQIKVSTVCGTKTLTRTVIKGFI